MVGERGDRDREAVRWELGEDTTPPPFSNGGLQMGTQCGSTTTGFAIDETQQMASTGYGSHGTVSNIGFRSSITGGESGGGASGGGGGCSGGGGAGFGGGSTGKEVRYAPFPVTSPSHSNYNQTSQAPLLQRAHSRYLIPLSKF